MFQYRHSYGSGFTYGLTYPTPHMDHLGTGLESTKRLARRDTPNGCVVLVANVNALESRIIKLNSNIDSLRRKHKHDRKALPTDRIRALRYTKCEGYGHETHQCPNWNATPMTNEDLKNYMLYLEKRRKKRHCKH